MKELSSQEKQLLLAASTNINTNPNRFSEANKASALQLLLQIKQQMNTPANIQPIKRVIII